MLFDGYVTLEGVCVNFAKRDTIVVGGGVLQPAQ